MRGRAAKRERGATKGRGPRLRRARGEEEGGREARRTTAATMTARTHVEPSRSFAADMPARRRLASAHARADDCANAHDESAKVQLFAIRTASSSFAAAEPRSFTCEVDGNIEQNDDDDGGVSRQEWGV